MITQWANQKFGKKRHQSINDLKQDANALANEEPEIAELMSKVTFTNAQMGEILAWQEGRFSS